VTCPACGGTLSPWLSVPSGEPGDPRSFPLSRCSSCGSAVTGGEPPDASSYSSGVYGPDPPRGAPLVRSVQRLVDRQVVGLVAGPRVLDVGAGRGRLVASLRRAGLDASGIDPSGRGDLVERRAIEEVSASDLDSTVMWHVLEHLDDPGSALERVRGWLRPGGTLVVASPNLDSWQARIAGPAWLHFDAPRHRVHFTAKVRFDEEERKR
jgi:SAM-dependent methyltransferase